MRYLPAIVWMGMIFYLSHQPGSDSAATSHEFVLFVLEIIPIPENYQLILHLMIRKSAHFFAYAILAMLIFYAYKGKRAIFTTLTICLLYAISDEVHQLFIPGRSGDIRDVLIDLTGALFGIIVIKLIKLIKRSGEV